MGEHCGHVLQSSTGINLGMELLGQRVGLSLVAPVLLPTSSRFLLFSTSSILNTVSLSNFSHSGEGVVVSHCALI
jgi:hypothetical protein